MYSAIFQAKDEMIEYGERLMHRLTVKDIMQNRPEGREPSQRHAPLLFDRQWLVLPENTPVPLMCDLRLSPDEKEHIAWAEFNLVSALIPLIEIKETVRSEAELASIPGSREPKVKREAPPEQKHAYLVERSLAEAYARPYQNRKLNPPKFQIEEFVRGFSIFAETEIRQVMGISPVGL